MRVKELLGPLRGSTPVNIFDEDEKRVTHGSCYNLWSNLDNGIAQAPVTSFSTNRGNIDIYIILPQPTNFDKLKELFPGIKRVDTYDDECEMVEGLDGATKFRAEWLDTEYDGE